MNTPSTPPGSATPGMGAIPHPGGGTTFRVWLPHASAVCVAGTFNDWSTRAHPLESEGNGYWSNDIGAANLGDRYRYVISGPYIDGIQWRTDPYCKSVENTAEGNGAIVTDTFNWADDRFQMPPWNELIIYELHVASFNGQNAQPGNFGSIIGKLDYLRDLGVNAIEILPIEGFPGTYSLGYNPALPFDIESSYGSPDDFKTFILAAHQRGIAVILDIVLNHFGPDDLDTSLRRPDGWYMDNRDGVYFYSDWREQTGFGPRPDYGRGEVRAFLKDSALLWLNEYRVDGLRFDSTVNVRNVYGNNNDPAHDLPDGWSLMVWINDEIDRSMPWKIAIAEDLQDNAWITYPTSEEGAGFDSQWDAYYYWRIVDAVVVPDDGLRDMNSVAAALTHSLGPDMCKRLIFFNNHDQCAAINNTVRLPDRIWQGNADSWFARKRYTLTAGVLCTTPGIPMIFQGDEFYTWGSWDPHVDLDWSQLQRFPGIYALFRDLFHLRRSLDGLKSQHIALLHVNNTDKLIAWQRDGVVMVANYADKSYDSYTIPFPNPGTWYVRFNSDASAYSPDFGNHPGYDTTASQYGNVGIGPYTLLILSQ